MTDVNCWTMRTVGSGMKGTETLIRVETWRREWLGRKGKTNRIRVKKEGKTGQKKRQ